MRGEITSLHILPEPELIERTAVDAFDNDPARAAVPPADAPCLPRLRTAMLALEDELTHLARGGGFARAVSGAT